MLRERNMPNLTETNNKNEIHNGRKIVVVGNSGLFPDNVINHSVRLAERLGYELVAISVDTNFEGKAFENRTTESARKLCGEADRSGIRCSHIIRSGDIGFVVEDIIHEIRRVEIVVIDSEANNESIRNISVPVVSVLSSSNGKGGNVMPAQSGSSKAKLIGKTAGYGLLSAAFCAAVFTNSNTVAQYCAKGGWFSVLPIATVLVFSFVHGAFAHNLWSLLGIEAFKRDQLRQTEHKVIEKRKQQRKRPRAYAYVNPFHRIDR